MVVSLTLFAFLHLITFTQCAIFNFYICECDGIFVVILLFTRYKSETSPLGCIILFVMFSPFQQ